MYLRTGNSNYNQKQICRSKTLLRSMLFTIIVLLEILFSSLSDTESAPVILIDSLNSDRVIYFDFGKADLKQESLYLLDRLIERLISDRNAKIDITGHTDNIGSEMFNDELSLKRAEAVKMYLVQHGVPEENIIIKGQGFKNPLADNITDENRALNRRVEFKWLQQFKEPAEQRESDESYVNTGTWKSKGNELTGQLSIRDTSGEPVTGISNDDVSAVIKWKQNDTFDSAQGTVKLLPIDDKKKIAFTFTMDYSGSMFNDSTNRFPPKSQAIEQMEKAVLTFINNMNSTAYGRIIKFGNSIRELVKFTRSKDALKDAVTNYTENLFGTALYRSIWFALKDTTYNSNPTVMKTVIAFTDGEENSSGKITKDSIFGIADQTGIRVYTVGLIDEFKHSTPVGMKSYGEADLVEISKRTGGFYYWAKDPAVLPLIYKQIYDQIMKSYNISIFWNEQNLPPKGTPVTAMVRVNVKGMIRTLYKNYVME